MAHTSPVAATRAGAPGEGAAAGRVLIDGRPLHGTLSGVGQYVWHLADSLVVRSEGFSIELLAFDHALRRNHALRRRPFHGTVVEQRFSVVPRQAFNAVAAYVPAVPARVFGLQPDLFHSTYFERMPRLSRTTSLVSTIHDVAFLRHPDVFSAINLAASRRALRWQVEASDAIVTPSQFTKDELVSLCDVEPSRITVTPLAVTEGAWAPPPPGRGDVDRAPTRGRPFVLYLGNLDPRKNLLLLLDAWRESDLGRTHDLVLAGQMSAHDRRLQDRLSTSDDASVVVLGFVPPSLKHQLLRECACFVYPSLYEGFGIPVLEAMAAGAPIVTSTAGALVELTDGAAVCVPATDLEGLGEAITRVLADRSQQQRMAELGRHRASTFSWARTAQLTTSVYRAVLG